KPRAVEQQTKPAAAELHGTRGLPEFHGLCVPTASIASARHISLMAVTEQGLVAVIRDWAAPTANARARAHAEMVKSGAIDGTRATGPAHRSGIDDFA